MTYYHLDVFSSKPLCGNGLTVLFQENALEPKLMQCVAREFKQFETIFIRRIGKTRFRARIFTLEEELDFAGHPVLGAAAAIHDAFFQRDAYISLTFELNRKTVDVSSRGKTSYYEASMNQGLPTFLRTVDGSEADAVLHALHLSPEQRHPALPMEVVSTGLTYLLVPIRTGLKQARPAAKTLLKLLEPIGAKFVYVFDPAIPEGRTWDGAGCEDVATGSAAGPVGAYLQKWGLCSAAEGIVLQQGRFLGRPCTIKVSFWPSGGIQVAGDVRILVKGETLF